MRKLNGRYRLDRRIAIGGASEVWRGHDEMLDRTVAVKVMRPGTGYDTLPEATTDAAAEVQAEARAAAALTHPNIAGVYDFGVYRNEGATLRYIVMELAEGETLAGHLRSGPLDWRIAVRVCAEVSAALSAAHLRGFVHRDIKPANVILTPYGAKVLDFGIAIMAGRPDTVEAGTIVGTPAFMAPERYDGGPAEPATDMYALGVLLHLCLAGRLPWPVTTEPGIAPPKPEGPPEALPSIDGLPDEVVEVRSNCLDNDPARRPSSFVAALLLAEAAETSVHLPSVATAPAVTPDGTGAMVGTGMPSTWTTDAADARTEQMSSAPVGRHRAD
jgi:serine/threonine protein kinase